MSGSSSVLASTSAPLIIRTPSTTEATAAEKGSTATEQVGALALKGLTQPVVAYNVPLATSQPALRVIEGGPPSA